MNYQGDSCGLEASRSYMVHLHLGLCPCKEIRMNRQGLFSNISLIYVRLPEQWKSVMYMPVCSEIEALVCSFGDHFFSKWSIPYRTGAIWPAGSEWWILKSFGMGSFLICVVCCIWWGKNSKIHGISPKSIPPKSHGMSWVKTCSLDPPRCRHPSGEERYRNWDFRSRPFLLSKATTATKRLAELRDFCS